jgi:hypothetical protein
VERLIRKRLPLRDAYGCQTRFEVGTMRGSRFLVLIVLLGLVYACTPMESTNTPLSQPAHESSDEALPSIQAIDAQLDSSYAEIRRLYAHDPGFLAKMETAQETFRRFRTAHLESLYPANDKALVYGRVFGRCYQTAYVAVTRQRIEQLQMWIKGRPEGDVCAGSIGFHSP